MDTQDLKEELSKILELSSTTIENEQNKNTDTSGMIFTRASSHVSFKDIPESSLEVVPISMSFTTLNIEKKASHVTIKTDPSAMVTQNKTIDREENDKTTSMTLNIAANEFVPAKDVHDLPNLPKIPSSSRPFSRKGHTQDEKSVASVMHAFEDQLNGQNQEEKTHLPSKIPRLTINEYYFPRQESEMSIRELREIQDQQNAKIPIDKSQTELAEFFVLQMARRTAEGKIVTLVGQDTKTSPNVPQKEEDEVEIDRFIRKMSNDIWSTAGRSSSNPTKPLIESDLSMEEFLIQRFKIDEVKSANPCLSGVEEVPAKQSSFSLIPQTSLTGSTSESQEAIVDDDGYENNFPKVPSGNLSSVESTVWMDTNASFIIEEPTVSNFHHVKLSTGLKEPFPRTSQFMDDNSSIDIPAVTHTYNTPQPEISKKKSKKSIIKRISSLFHRRSSQQD